MPVIGDYEFEKKDIAVRAPPAIKVNIFERGFLGDIIQVVGVGVARINQIRFPMEVFGQACRQPVKFHRQFIGVG